ncbi:Dehydrogenase [Minicystis rosea]|nr:Dehydrogenase [Minicystis rosea]
MNGKHRIVVIGGGLAGLAAAAYAARAGKRVTVLEKAQAPGGRAATQHRDGFHFNLGPHALYQGGPATSVLAELGVTARGALPPASGYALDGDRLHVLPGGPISMLTTSLLTLAGKVEIARFMLTMRFLDVAALARTSTTDLIAEKVRTPEARRFLAALFRLSTYTDELDRLSAGAAIVQLRRAVEDGVHYLDGGWASLVTGLRAAAVTAGAEILTGAKAEAIERRAGGVAAVRIADGRRLEADRVIIAAAPETARALCPGVPALDAWVDSAVPVLASCLDVALSRLLVPRQRFVLGVDRPLYFSEHATVAKVAPDGGALIHVARYGRAADTEAVEQELEALLERAQPGFRDVLVHRRFLPAMIVAHDLPEAARGGLAARASSEIPGAPGILLAGDWVGPEGMLADASLASARAAARLAVLPLTDRTRLEAAPAPG